MDRCGTVLIKARSHAMNRPVRDGIGGQTGEVPKIIPIGVFSGFATDDLL